MCTLETYEEVDAWCCAQTAAGGATDPSPAAALPPLRLQQAETGADGRRHWCGRRAYPILLACPRALLTNGIVGVDPAQPQMPQLAASTAGLGFDLRTPLGKGFLRYIAHGLVPILETHGFVPDADLPGDPPDYTATVDRLAAAVALGHNPETVSNDDCEPQLCPHNSFSFAVTQSCDAGFFLF